MPCIWHKVRLKLNSKKQTKERSPLEVIALLEISKEVRVVFSFSTVPSSINPLVIGTLISNCINELTYPQSHNLPEQCVVGEC